MPDNVIIFPPAAPSDEDKRAHRRRFFHFRGQPVEEMDPALGTPEEWMESATDHLLEEIAKRNRIDRFGGGYAEVSVAAIELVLRRLGEIEFDSDPSGGEAA